MAEPMSAGTPTACWSPMPRRDWSRWRFLPLLWSSCGGARWRRPKKRHNKAALRQTTSAIVAVMLRDVFITGCGRFLPGEPIANDRMEEHLGHIHGRPSLLGRRGLRWKRIEAGAFCVEHSGPEFRNDCRLWGQS